MHSNSDDIIKVPQGFWESLKLLGVNTREVIYKARIPDSSMNEPLVLKKSQYLAVWQIYDDLIGDTSEAIIKLVDVYKVSKYPPSFLTIYHSYNYRNALRKMAKYKQLCPPEKLTFQEKGDQCYIDLDHDADVPTVLIGSTLASILEVGRRGTDLKINATLLELTNPLNNIQELESYFGCEVKTQSPYNRLTLKRSDLDLLFVSSNEEVLSMLIPPLDRILSEQLINQTYTETVRNMLRTNLSIENIGIETISNMMRIGSRTLQRKLFLEGTNFKKLLLQVRHEKSLDYLTNTSLSIKEISYLIGYTDQNSFYRAFRLWENDTPTNWRRNSNSSLVNFSS